MSAFGRREAFLCGLVGLVLGILIGSNLGYPAGVDVAWPGGWRPWGWGFAPFMGFGIFWIFFWLLLIRGLFWGRPWGRRAQVLHASDAATPSAHRETPPWAP